jgi:hypothetical protein
MARATQTFPSSAQRVADESGGEFEKLIGRTDVIHVTRLGQLVATLPEETATYRDILREALP